MHPVIHVQNLNRNIQEPPLVKSCETFACRLLGLMLRRHLPQNEGLLLVIGNDSRIDSSIHMLFVGFDLSVFWIDSTMKVVDKVIARSWRPAYIPSHPSRYTLEMHSSRFGDFEIGDKVEFQNA